MLLLAKFIRKIVWILIFLVISSYCSVAPNAYVPNSQIIGSYNSSIGSMATVSCVIGYQSVGSMVVTCVAYNSTQGYWNGPSSTCNSMKSHYFLLTKVQPQTYSTYSHNRKKARTYSYLRVLQYTYSTELYCMYIAILLHKFWLYYEVYKSIILHFIIMHLFEFLFLKYFILGIKYF